MKTISFFSGRVVGCVPIPKQINIIAGIIASQSHRIQGSPDWAMLPNEFLLHACIINGKVHHNARGQSSC